MDANPVASRHDAFDALLDASSLGAPRVQAVRRRTPATVRDLLASHLIRRSLPAAETPEQAASLPEQVAEGTRLPLPRVGGQEPQHAPEGSGSHPYGKIKNDSGTGRVLVFVSHSSPHEYILYQLNALTRDFAGLAERILPNVSFDSFSGCPKGALKAIEAAMETRFLRQLFFPEKDSSRIGRYGMGAKLALASPLIREEMWRSGTLSGGVLGNGRSEHTDGSCHAVLPGGLGRWFVLWPYASDPSVRGMSTQMGQGRDWVTSHLLCTATTQRPQRRDAWWSPDEMDAHAGLHDWLSGGSSQGSTSSFGRQRTNSGNDRRPWLDQFLAVNGPGAPARLHAVPQTMWEQLVYGFLESPAPGSYGCLTAHHYGGGLRVSLEERQTPGTTGAAGNRVHGFSGRYPAHQDQPRVRMTVSTYTRPDDRMRVPALASQFVMATRTAELLWTDLSETFREQVVLPLPVTLELLLSAVGGTDLTRRACRIEAVQEAATVWETARLILLAGNFRIATPTVLTSHCSNPYAVRVASEGPARVQTVWTLVHDLLGPGMQQGSSGHSNACVGTVDRQSGDQADTGRDIRVNTTEGEAVLQLKQADLTRLPDSTRENTDNQNERHRMPSAWDALFAEWLSDAHRH